MSDADEIDALILDILLRSERGRQWLEAKAAERKKEDRLRKLLRSGLDIRVVTQMWMYADVETMDQATAMMSKQIRAVNRAYREATRA